MADEKSTTAPYGSSTPSSIGTLRSASNTNQKIEIAFKVRWKKPKGRDLKMFVIGNVAELGSATFGNNWCSAFSKGLLASWRREIYTWLTDKQKGSVAQFNAGGPDEASDDGSSSSSNEDDEHETQKLVNFYRASVPPGEIRAHLNQWLENTFVCLEEDPECTGEIDLWQSDFVTLRSMYVGQVIHFCFAVFRMDTEDIWEVEQFIDPRNFTIPRLNPMAKTHRYILKAEKFGERTETLVPVRDIPQGNPYESDGDDFEDI